MRGIIHRNVLREPVDQFQFREGVIEAIMDDGFQGRVVNALLAYDPICSLVNACQKSNTNIAYATEKWLRLELPLVNERFEEALDERLNRVLNEHGLAANFLHPQYKGRRFINNLQCVALMNQFFQENLSPQGFQELHEYTNETGMFERIFARRYNSCRVFWRRARRFYPELSLTAVRLLHIPASTGDLERLFSEWSLVHRKTRNRLGEDKSARLIALYYSLGLRNANNIMEAHPDDQEGA